MSPRLAAESASSGTPRQSLSRPIRTRWRPYVNSGPGGPGSHPGFLAVKDEVDLHVAEDPGANEHAAHEDGGHAGEHGADDRQDGRRFLEARKAQDERGDGRNDAEVDP